MPAREIGERAAGLCMHSDRDITLEVGQREGRVPLEQERASPPLARRLREQVSVEVRA